MSIYESTITNPKKQLEFYKDLSEQLEWENQKLKKQLEEINNFINKASFVNIEQLMLDYCAKVEQQKEFIEWLENKMNETHYAVFEFQAYRLAFEKYKEIIGADTNEK